MVGVSWRRARRIAMRMDPVAATRVDLPSAVGTVLARPVAAVTDLPAFDAADYSGWAVSGVGPWTIDAESGPVTALGDGRAARVTEGSMLPVGCNAVLPEAWAVLEDTARHRHLLVGDPTTGRPSRRPGFLEPGSGIRPARSHAAAGDLLIKCGGRVTAGTIALAAAAGCDDLTVVPPASVAVVVPVSSLLASGPPRRGRDRDVLAPLVPAWVMAAGGRCLPEIGGAADPPSLADAIDSAGADVVVVTATDVPGIDQAVDSALSRLQAEVLIDRLRTVPAGPVRLAELRDGRRVLALPREPAAAVVSCALLLNPMIAASAGRLPDPIEPTAILRAEVPDPSVERAVPVVTERGELADLAQPQSWFGPHGLSALGTADGLAVLDPGRGRAGEIVPVIALPGASF